MSVIRNHQMVGRQRSRRTWSRTQNVPRLIVERRTEAGWVDERPDTFILPIDISTDLATNGPRS